LINERRADPTTGPRNAGQRWCCARGSVTTTPP